MLASVALTCRFSMAACSTKLAWALRKPSSLVKAALAMAVECGMAAMDESRQGQYKARQRAEAPGRCQTPAGCGWYGEGAKKARAVKLTRKAGQQGDWRLTWKVARVGSAISVAVVSGSAIICWTVKARSCQTTRFR